MLNKPTSSTTPSHPRSALEGRPFSVPLLIVSAIAAILFHGGLAAFVFYLTFLGEKDIKKKIEPKLLRFDEVQLLALGEEKPKNALPQIANPAPKTRRTDPVVINQQPTSKNDVVIPKKKEEKPEPQNERPPVPTKSKKSGNTNVEAKDAKGNRPDSDILDALSALHDPERPTNNVIPEGSPDGVVGGTTSDAALANMMNTYQARLLQELAKTWQLPTTLSRKEISSLAGKVSAYVRISSTGSIISYRFTRTSGNHLFDGSINRVLQKYTVQGGRKLPLPKNPQLKKTVLKKGLTLSDWKSIQR